MGLPLKEKSSTISIHALREEGDLLASLWQVTGKLFLSTPSARRATFCPPFLMRAYSHFYPRPPRGGRQMSAFAHSSLAVFLSTPSARRATCD